MNENFKPDLGTLFWQKGNKDTLHHFYSVLCEEIQYVGNNLYSFTTATNDGTSEFALSFDFSLDTLDALLKQIIDADLQKYLISILLEDFSSPQKAIFTNAPFLLDITAKLGEPVKSLYETFTPFIVETFTILVSSGKK